MKETTQKNAKTNLPNQAKNASLVATKTCLVHRRYVSGRQADWQRDGRLSISSDQLFQARQSCHCIFCCTLSGWASWDARHKTEHSRRKSRPVAIVLTGRVPCPAAREHAPIHLAKKWHRMILAQNYPVCPRFAHSLYNRQKAVGRFAYRIAKLRKTLLRISILNVFICFINHNLGLLHEVKRTRSINEFIPERLTKARDLSVIKRFD